MSAEINFIKSKWLLSEFNKFRITDPAFLKVKENRKQWWLNNREKLVKAQCKYAANNKEKVSKAVKKWQKENKDKIAEYQKNNKEKINAYQNKRNRAISEIKSLTN